jgi:hypothetical protein
VSRRTQVPKPLVLTTFRVRGSHPLWRILPDRFRYAPVIERDLSPLGPYNPEALGPGLGSSPFARRYWGNLV